MMDIFQENGNALIHVRQGLFEQVSPPIDSTIVTLINNFANLSGVTRGIIVADDPKKWFGKSDHLVVEHGEGNLTDSEVFAILGAIHHIYPAITSCLLHTTEGLGSTVRYVFELEGQVVWCQHSGSLSYSGPNDYVGYYEE